MKIQTEFWYESNACWGNVKTLNDLVEKIKLQIEEPNGINNVDEFLDKSFQNTNGTNDFGTRTEHRGKKSLRVFLEEQNFNFIALLENKARA